MKNLANVTPGEQAAVADELKRALQRHHTAKALEARAQAEYDRVRQERIWKPQSWRLRWAQLVDEIADSELREAVRSPESFSGGARQHSSGTAAFAQEFLEQPYV